MEEENILMKSCDALSLLFSIDFSFQSLPESFSVENTFPHLDNGLQKDNDVLETNSNGHPYDPWYGPRNPMSKLQDS